MGNPHARGKVQCTVSTLTESGPNNDRRARHGKLDQLADGRRLARAVDVIESVEAGRRIHAVGGDIQLEKITVQVFAPVTQSRARDVKCPLENIGTDAACEILREPQVFGVLDGARSHVQQPLARLRQMTQHPEPARGNVARGAGPQVFPLLRVDSRLAGGGPTESVVKALRVPGYDRALGVIRFWHSLRTCGSRLCGAYAFPRINPSDI